MKRSLDLAKRLLSTSFSFYFQQAAPWDRTRTILSQLYTRSRFSMAEDPPFADEKSKLSGVANPWESCGSSHVSLLLNSWCIQENPSKYYPAEVALDHMIQTLEILHWRCNVTAKCGSNMVANRAIYRRCFWRVFFRNKDELSILKNAFLDFNLIYFLLKLGLSGRWVAL